MDLLNTDLDGKCSIFLWFRENVNRVSWDSAADFNDIQYAVSCACDSIVDNGFLISDRNGIKVDFHDIKPGEEYWISEDNEKDFAVDRKRRLVVEVDPLIHSESMRAIEIMRNGSCMIKHRRNSLPHVRLVRVDEELKDIIWGSVWKPMEICKVSIEDVIELELGQETEKFLEFPIPAYKELSFTIIHSKGSLDLTCKDQQDFDFWLIGLKALICQSRSLQISKKTLLSHSRSFNQYFNLKKFSLATSSLYNPKPLAFPFPTNRSLSRLEISHKLLKVRYSLSRFQPFSSSDLNLASKLEQYNKELTTLELEYSNKLFCPSYKDSSELETNLWHLELSLLSLAASSSFPFIPSPLLRLKSWLISLF